MYAVVDTWALDLDKLTPEQQRELPERIVPMVRAQPGFIAGYWTYDGVNKKSHGLFLFESEETARGLKAFVEQDSQRGAEIGVHLNEIAVTEVVAEARAGAAA
jgi:hypothetical protein